MKLTKPIEHGGKTYSELNLPDEVLVEHLFALDAVKGEQKQNAAMMAAIVGVPFQVIGKLPVADYVKLQGLAKPLMDQMQELQDDVGNEAGPDKPGLV